MLSWLNLFRPFLASASKTDAKSKNGASSKFRYCDQLIDGDQCEMQLGHTGYHQSGFKTWGPNENTKQFTVEELRNRYEQRFQKSSQWRREVPSLSYCSHCKATWNRVPAKTIELRSKRSGTGFFVVCEECWLLLVNDNALQTLEFYVTATFYEYWKTSELVRSDYLNALREEWNRSAT